MDLKRGLAKDIEEFKPAPGEKGWGNEILLEWLSRTLENNPALCSEAYAYFQWIQPDTMVNRIVKDTVAATLAEYDHQFHQDIYDWLSVEEQWTQKDFDDFPAYRQRPR